ncbi:MAG: NAD(P)H-dependent oxidoreductase [Firmicutes bacterium]|nr:NAD(P)H-dependent oxidoreductase [Bacillota bacterium]
MKKHSVKTISLLLVLILITSLLSACSSDPGNSGTASGTETETQESAPSEASSTPEEVSADESAEVASEESAEAASDESTEVSSEENAQDSSSENTEKQTSEEPAEPVSKVLVIYFSHTGTTREVAAYLHELVGGDLFEIVPLKPYPEGYSAALDPAKKEQRENARPAIKDPIESIDQYEVIYLGYPIWWGTVPMIIHTFLESYDFTGKTVVPFATSGGTGIGQSVEDIRSEIPDTEVPDGLLVRNNEAIAPWLQELGLIQ